MTDPNRRAVIDIGSNSVRLVIFGGAARSPVVLYNEKLMAGLGRGVIATGQLSKGGMELALRGLARFQTLIAHMGVISMDAVATAAVRDASNGAEFIQRARDIGLNVRILTGEEEAAAAGYGVLSALPGANGIVADLGGGSLELVRVCDGAVHDRVSLPLGILKVPDIRAQGLGKLTRHVKALADSIDWVEECSGLPLYLVGGSWRSLARIHMMQEDFPLTVLGNYSMAPGDARPLSDHVAQMAKAEIKAVPAMPSSRVPMVADAAALLAALTEAVSPSTLMICPFGLREGLLFQTLTDAEQQLDPLIEGVRFFARTQQQIDGYGDALMAWMDGVFDGEPAELRRLRHAACLLHGTGWASNPDFRAIGGEELALHGNWAGISPADRAIMGMALFIGMGGGAAEEPEILAQLADEPSLNRAQQWGLAMRLAQRLSGGAPSILQHCPVGLDAAHLRLTLPGDYTALDEPPLRKRLAALAAACGLDGSTMNSGASLSPSPVE